MVKQYLAAVLEDLIGEYVLNISKENLKLAALSGKIKLDNIELDGDYIGSHVIGALGLQGFGVLSCYAKSLQIHVPWKNLDEPTSLEIHGMHLVCVPLLPTTATRVYYGGGISGGSSASQSTFHDGTPRCSLRTRAKRSAIARFERKFFSGRIPGEGPEIEKEEGDNRTLNYNGRRQQWSLSVSGDEDLFTSTAEADLMSDLPINGSVKSEHSGAPSTASKQTLKEKITSKIYQNLISSINDVHIRFEVPEGALDMSLTGRRDDKTNKKSNTSHDSLAVSDQNAFAFGLVLQRLSVQNIVDDVDKIKSARLGDKSCKTIEIRNLSIYWDDGPSFLLTESDSVKGLFTVPIHKLQKRIAEVMKQMSVRQDPGEDTVQKLNSLNSPIRKPFARKHSKSDRLRAHEYICTNSTLTIQTEYTTEMSGNSSYFVDIFPSRNDIDVTSRQFRQYQLLKNAILSQQRFDTMLHGRPKKSPLEDPRSWWRYAILCVQHRPNSRPWGDVQQIVRCRKKYIDLVVKNLESETERTGFHGGLSSAESQALLELENLLPIETLLAFHLLALRRVLDRRSVHKDAAASAKFAGPRKQKSSSLRRLWKSVSGSKNTWRPLDDVEFDPKTVPVFPSSLTSNRQSGILQPRETVRFGESCAVNEPHLEPISETKYHLRQSELRISLLDSIDQKRLVTVNVALKGNSLSSGEYNEKYTCDIMQFDVYDFVTNGALFKRKVLTVEGVPTTIAPNEDEIRPAIWAAPVPVRDSSSVSSVENLQFNRIHCNEENLPTGVVCRLTALADENDISLSLVAHPATIVWNNICANAVAEFFHTSTPDVQVQFLNQLRSATTPGSHKRQLELLYPTSISISIDVHAPKLWIPISSNAADGALYVDAGKLKMAADKPSKSSTTRWGLDLSDIQIKFLREDDSDALSLNTGSIDLDSVTRSGNELTIVYPFNIGVTGLSTESVEIPFSDSFVLDASGQNTNESIAGEISVTVGKIRLNLVDVEVLAKSFGRYYASQLLRFTKKTPKKGQTHNIADGKSASPISLTFELCLSFEQIEAALESYSHENAAEKKTKRNRTYLMTISHVTMQQRSKGPKQFSRLMVRDISLIQLVEVKKDGRRVLKPGTDLVHKILGKKDIDEHCSIESPKNPNVTPPVTPKAKLNHHPLRTPKELRLTSTRQESTANSPCEFIRVCHFKDGENHVDEVEFDIISMLVRVTPTSIVDLTKASARLFELIKLASKEMERRVHAGRRDKFRSVKSRSTLHNLEETRLLSPMSLPEEEHVPTDSSIIYRVTFRGASLFIGRPSSEFSTPRASKRHGTSPHDYVIHLLTNASVLVQSIENPDASGSKTVHLSLEDMSASVSNIWTGIEGANQFISPAALDLRAVYQTVEEGMVVSQHFSVDSEVIQCSVMPRDVNIIHSICRKVIEKLSALHATNKQSNDKAKPTPGLLRTLVYAKEKGSGIATNVRCEIMCISIVAIYEEKGKKPCLDFNASHLKLRLDGVAACLTGELSSVIKLCVYHNVSGWGHVIEPTKMQADISQMPDEQIFTIRVSDPINVNFTGHLLQEMSNLNRVRKNQNVTSTSASKKGNITFTNSTGIDVVLSLGPVGGNYGVKDGDSIVLDYQSLELEDASGSQMVFLHGTDREPVSKLPLVSASERSTFLYKWPLNSSRNTGKLEPVVELVVQNQRLRSNVADVFGVDRGTDLLSSTTWSPDFNTAEAKSLWQKPYLDGDAPEFSDLTGRLKKTKESIILPGDDWIWADKWEVEIHDEFGVTTDADGWEYSADFETFTANRQYYKRGDLCEIGFEYVYINVRALALNFPFLLTTKGRRRRWTRHRVMKNNDAEGNYLVWEFRNNENGCVTVEARSHLTLTNNTTLPLAFFAHNALLDSEYFIGCSSPEHRLNVPVQLASVTHLRLAIPKIASSYIDNASELHVSDCYLSEPVMILSSGLNSTRILRTAILCDSTAIDENGLSSLKTLHFILKLKTIEGVCEISIEPVMTLINLLPCQMQVQLGESVGRRATFQGKQVVQTEEILVAVGKEVKSLSVNSCLKPHISVRLPGYRWSSWNKIINRTANSQTWLPLNDEQGTLFNAPKDQAEYLNEYKTIIHLDNKHTGGTGLDIIMSVEAGHSPSIRIFAQYWVLDKSGFGLRLTDNFDFTGQQPDLDSLRQSFSSLDLANNSALAPDIKLQGCEWSIGMNGMTLFLSKKERVSFSVIHDEDVTSETRISNTSASRWSAFIDISKAISKTTISVDDITSKRRFELAYHVTSCPSVFSRTLMITFFPRYQIANLLQQDLFVVQDGASDRQLIPSQSWLPFHWEDHSLPPKIRIACKVDNNPGLWTKGCITLNQIGITAIRIPTMKRDERVVVQVEVRLSTKKQNSAVLIVIWSSIEKANPLYTLRNDSQHTIFCSQPLLHEDDEGNPVSHFDCLSNEELLDATQDSQTGALGRIAREHDSTRMHNNRTHGSNLKSIVNEVLRGGCNGCNLSRDINNINEREEFVWTLQPGESIGFGFDNPALTPHLLEWTCLTSSALLVHGEDSDVGRIDLDNVGAFTSVTLLDGDEVKCQIVVEQSTKVVLFTDSNTEASDYCVNGLISLTVQLNVPGVNISIIDDICDVPKEIILITTEGWLCNFSQTREGLHELEFKLSAIQADNFILNAEHPVLFITQQTENDQFAHCSIVRHLNQHDSTFVISYAALRFLEMDICLDRKTAETLANFLLPFRKAREKDVNTEIWITTLTQKMSSNYSKRSRRAPRDVEKMIHNANVGRVYIENLHLHPIRLFLTFTQEWLESNHSAGEGLIAFQLIRGMTSIADAPLTFTSFIVGNAFESLQSLRGIIINHYNSQLTSQIFPLLFNMAVLKAPVEFVTNVGSGVIRFFYEPINALVYTPEKFVERLELGTHHLARGVFVGFVKGAANLTYLINNNLVTLASDEAFADTRRAYQKQLESTRSRTLDESMSLASACIARGFESGTKGIFEHPASHASRHGAIGLVTGVGKAIVGAVVKPVVGVGDAAVVVMNHVGDATSEKVVVVKETKRIRRALPRISTALGTSVDLIPYDVISAKAQRIVTGGESVDDIYFGHVTITSHLIISSRQCLWTIDKDSREPWCISWSEISHFSIDEGNSLTITVFSSQGQKSFVFNMSSDELAEVYDLLLMQTQKMGNMNALGTMSYANIRGIKSPQAAHIFGSINKSFKVEPSDLDTDVKLIERCNARVNTFGSSMLDFFIRLDQEAWLLVNSSSQLFTGLYSRRCISIGLINGCDKTLHIKSARLIEGDSQCHIIPTIEYDRRQQTLAPGGSVIVFARGMPPSLLQPGRVLIEIETDIFSCTMSDKKVHDTTIHSLPGYQVGFLEKSYDESGWWAKYWMMLKREDAYGKAV